MFKSLGLIRVPCVAAVASLLTTAYILEVSLEFYVAWIFFWNEPFTNVGHDDISDSTDSASANLNSIYN